MTPVLEARWQAALATVHPRRRRVDRVLRVAAAPFFAALCLLLAEIATAPARWQAAADVAARAATDQLGVAVVWRLDDATTAPPASLNGTPVGLRPVRARDAARAVDVVQEALAVYPPGFARRLLDTLYVTGGLKIDDHPAGGMAYDRTIYVVAGDMAVASSRLFAYQTVFHETATLVMQQTVADRAAWERQWRTGNAPGFLYWTDGHLHLNAEEAIASLDMKKPTDGEMLEAGFLTQYGQTSIRADFDTYADAVFTETDQLKGWISAYPSIRRKVALFEQTYRNADPRFGPVFDRLGLGDLTP